MNNRFERGQKVQSTIITPGNTVEQMEEVVKQHPTLFPHIPAGLYTCEVVGHMEVASKDEKGNIKKVWNLIKCKIVEGVETGKHLSFFANDAASAVVDLHIATGEEFDTVADYVGCKLLLRATVVEKNGYKNTRATAYDKISLEKIHTLEFVAGQQFLSHVVQADFDPTSNAVTGVYKYILYFLDSNEVNEQRYTVLTLNIYAREDDGSIKRDGYNKMVGNALSSQILASLAEAIGAPVVRDPENVAAVLDNLNDYNWTKVNCFREQNTSDSGKGRAYTTTRFSAIQTKDDAPVVTAGSMDQSL